MKIKRTQIDFIEIVSDSGPTPYVARIDKSEATDLARDLLEVDRDPTEDEIMQAAETLAVFS